MNNIESTLANMERYGGSFVKQLAKLYRLADPTNKQKLLSTFDYFKEYEKPLMTIDEYKEVELDPDIVLSGVKCPNCEEEMYKVVKMMFATYPPKTRLVCKACNYYHKI